MKSRCISVCDMQVCLCMEILLLPAVFFAWERGFWNLLLTNLLRLPVLLWSNVCAVHGLTFPSTHWHCFYRRTSCLPHVRYRSERITFCSRTQGTARSMNWNHDHVDAMWMYTCSKYIRLGIKHLQWLTKEKASWIWTSSHRVERVLFSIMLLVISSYHSTGVYCDGHSIRAPQQHSLLLCKKKKIQKIRHKNLTG